MTALEPDRVARLVDRANGSEHLDALRAVAELQAAARRAEDEATARAINGGLTYATIARALGVSRQSVRVKYLTRLATGLVLSPVERQARYYAEWEERRRQAEALFDRPGIDRPEAPPATAPPLPPPDHPPT